MIDSLATVLSRAGGQRLLVLIFHRVLDRPDPLRASEVDVATFDWQMSMLRRYFRVLSLGEAIDLMSRNALPPRAACITFDDGYADNVSRALPVLQRHELRATFFIATGFLDGGRMWNDSVIEAFRVARGECIDLAELGLGTYRLVTTAERSSAIASVLKGLKYRPMSERDSVVSKIVERVGCLLPNDLMMRSEDVRALARAGMEVGGHTVHHPILEELATQEARAEIVEGKRQLEEICEQPVRVFAYPNGIPVRDFSRRHVEILGDCGFVGAVTTAWGVGSSGGDNYQIPRFTPWDRTPRRFLLRLFHNYTRIRPLMV